jgi:transcription-repair coupling factor (superfamily II helicase)
MVELSDYKQVLEIENEMRDRFGKLPVEAKNLVYLVEMKLLGTQLELKQVKIGSNEMYIQFYMDDKLSRQELIQQRLVSIVNKTSNAVTFIQTGKHELGMKVQLPEQLNDQLNAARNFLQSLI